MRSPRSFEVEPWLKSAGQQVWTRIRRGLATQEQELHESLVNEVEQLRGARNSAQRATQLARVLDAVFAYAEAHELSEAQLSALREARPQSRSLPVMELARKLESRAVQVLDQMLRADPAESVATAQTALSVRTEGYGLDALVSWLTPRVISDARPARSVHKASQPAAAGVARTPAAPRTGERASHRAAPSASARAGEQGAARNEPMVTGRPHAPDARRQPLAAGAGRVPAPAASPASPGEAAPQPNAATAIVVSETSTGPNGTLLRWLRSDMTADLSFARAGMDAARASVQVTSDELSLRLRVTHQAALDAAQWFSRKRRTEIAVWLLSRGAQLVLRKWVIPQLARADLGPQLLLKAALASTGKKKSAKRARPSLPKRAAAASVKRVRRALSR